jgi:hypothetical protein
MRALQLECVILALAILSGGVAKAQDCAPLKYLGAFPISFNDAGFPTVDTLLNKTPTTLRLLGGDTNYLMHDTVEHLALRELKTPMKMYFSTGEISDTFVRVPELSVGPFTLKGLEFRVSGRTPHGIDALSLATFSNYDMDFDFYSKRFNLFSTDHCDGKAAYFSTSALTAIPYAENMEIPVVLDGHETKAILDIASPKESTIGLAEATALFGLTTSSPDVEHFQKGTVEGYRHQFSTLSFGGVTVRNVTFEIVPEKIKDMFKEKPTGSLLSASPFESVRIKMGIGQNVWRKLHIYIATKERKLYISPADESAAKLLPPLSSVSTK